MDRQRVVSSILRRSDFCTRITPLLGGCLRCLRNLQIMMGGFNTTPDEEMVNRIDLISALRCRPAALEARKF